MSTYTLVYKRYAPFTSFGGGFHGDGVAGANRSRSARTWTFVDFELGVGVTRSRGHSDPTSHRLLGKSTGVPTIKTNVTTNTATKLVFESHCAGSNPLVPGAPPIDTFMFMTFETTPGGLQVVGTMNGDDFPNGEVFLDINDTVRQMSRCELLCHFATSGGRNTGPVRLINQNKHTIIARISKLV